MRGKLAAAALMLAAQASPALAQTTPGAGIEAAQNALAAGRPDDAIAILNGLLAARPDDPDLLRRLAAAQAAKRDYAAALTTIDRAQARAPQDNDIRLARARILLWSGRTDEAADEAAAVAAAAPGYPDLAAVERAIAAHRHKPRRAGIAVAGSLSNVETRGGATSTWKYASLNGFTGIGDRSTLSGAVEYEARRTSDTRLSLRLDRQIGSGVAYLAVAGTPDASFREQWSIAGGGELPVSAAVDLLVDARYAEYPANDVATLQPAIRVRPVRGVAITGRWINLFQTDGGYRSGGSGRVDFEIGDAAGLYAGGATYPDTEAGITRQVDSVFAGATLPLNRQLTLRLGGEYERRRQSYTRKTLSLGFGWRFGS